MDTNRDKLLNADIYDVLVAMNRRLCIGIRAQTSYGTAICIMDALDVVGNTLCNGRYSEKVCGECISRYLNAKQKRITDFEQDNVEHC